MNYYLFTYYPVCPPHVKDVVKLIGILVGLEGSLFLLFRRDKMLCLLTAAFSAN